MGKIKNKYNLFLLSPTNKIHKLYILNNNDIKNLKSEKM